MNPHAWQECYVCGKSLPPSLGKMIEETEYGLLTDQIHKILIFICHPCERYVDEHTKTN